MAKNVATARPAPVILLTKADRKFVADFRKSSQAYVDRVGKTKESAMQELIDAGIYGTDGKLTKPYRPRA